jgi:hypothetical protein
MPDRGNVASRVVNVLATVSQSGANPSDSVAELHNLVVRRFMPTSDAMEMFTRFQQDPADTDLRTAVHGRLTEAMLIDARFAAAIEDTLHLVEIDDLQSSASQREFTTQLQGSMRGSAINQGSGTIDQSRRTRISFPLATLVLLLGGGVVAGGAAGYNAISSDAGAYTYYMGPDQDPQQNGFFVIDWTTRQSGDLSGTFKDANPNNGSLQIIGHQEGGSVEFWSPLATGYPIPMVFHCTIGWSSLTCQMPDKMGHLRRSACTRRPARDSVGLWLTVK